MLLFVMYTGIEISQTLTSQTQIEKQEEKERKEQQQQHSVEADGGCVASFTALQQFVGKQVILRGF